MTVTRVLTAYLNQLTMFSNSFGLEKSGDLTLKRMITFPVRSFKTSPTITLLRPTTNISESFSLRFLLKYQDILKDYIFKKNLFLNNLNTYILISFLRDSFKYNRLSSSTVKLALFVSTSKERTFVFQLNFDLATRKIVL